MKKLLLVLTLLSGAWVHADARVCSKYVGEDSEMARAVDFLRRYSGQYPLGQCGIELHVCESYSSHDDRGAMIGDILITDKFGRSFYVPLYFPRQNVREFHATFENGRIMFHYEYLDRMPNPATANMESLYLEILSEWDSPALASLHLGYYLKKDFLEKNHKHKYQWTICEANAEAPLD
ncbi:MAG TPA: hypothetical protein PKC28_11700 [Bdellovibrionales bacterium]|nr:hypothetical protein [Bdellovibrionales bacterium]